MKVFNFERYSYFPFKFNIFYLLLAAVLMFTFVNQITQSQENPFKGQSSSLKSILTQVPLYFIENKGQVDERALYYAKASGYTLWVTRGGLVFDSIRRKNTEEKGRNSHSEEKFSEGREERWAERLGSDSVYKREVSRLLFLNTMDEIKVFSVEETAHRVNYFIGNDPKKWTTDISTSKAVIYREIYKDIDLKVYGVEREVEYDWVVKPGGDAGDIRFAHQGVRETRIDEDGDIVIKTGFGELIHKEPVCYQVIEGERIDVECQFQIVKEDVYGFNLSDYDRDHELIIDPVVLLYSTYLGGNSSDAGFGIAVDNNGCAYVTGLTNSANFPTKDAYMTAPGDYSTDAFVTKLDPAGSGASSLLYSTYFGGSDYDTGWGIAVDANGYAYVIGETWSTDFPTKNAYMTDPGDYNVDAFVTKLDPAGSGASSLLYSTYLGGIYDDYGRGIAVDSNGYAYVTGITQSKNFPNKNQYQGGQGSLDAFVTKLDPAGSGASSLLYSTHLGANAVESGEGIAVDSNGYAYVTGYTKSANFPTKDAYMTDPGDYNGDAYVTKLDPAGSGASSLLYSTYLGGSSDDSGQGIAVDSNGYAYVTGFTYSANFPTKNAYMTAPGSNNDAFVTKLDPAGSGASSLLYSTYLGGSGGDSGWGIAVDSSGYAYVTGETWSTDFPTLNPYGVDPVDNNVDAYVTKLDPTGSGASSLLYSTYLGGNSFDNGRGIAVDSSGSAYVTGKTDSTNFHIKRQYMWDPGDNASDVFVSKLGIEATLPPVANDDFYSTYQDVPLEVSAPGVISNDVDDIGIQKVILVSDPSNGTIVLYDDGSFTYTPNLGYFGTDSFTYKANDGFYHSNTATVSITVNPISINDPPIADAGEAQTIHVGETAILDGSASYDPDENYPLSYSWDITSQPQGSTATLSNADTSSPILTTDVLGDYTIQLVVTDSLGLESFADEVVISTSNSRPVAYAGEDQAPTQIGVTIYLDGSQSYDDDGDPISHAWTMVSQPPGSTATLSDAETETPTFVPDLYGEYTIKLVVSDPWTSSDPDTVIVSFINVAPVADAGDNQAVLVWETVDLDGSASYDENLDPLSYSWSIVTQPNGSLAELSNTTSPLTSFIPDKEGIYIISLVVNDGQVDSDPYNVTVVATFTQNQVIQDLDETINVINSFSPDVFKNKNMQNALTNKIIAAIVLVNEGQYKKALDKIEHDIMAKTDGCATIGTPDKNDWIIDCNTQNQLYPMLVAIIQLLESLV